MKQSERTKTLFAQKCPILLASLLAFLPISAATATVLPFQGDVSLAIVGGRLIDGFGGKPIENAVVLLSGNQIAAIGRVGQLAVPAGVRTIDANGMTVMPGLWESHGHLFHVGEGKPTEFQVEFRDRAVEVMAAVAETTLMAGVTSFRDTGGPIEPQQKLRSKIREGTIPGPRLYLAGPILSQKSPSQATEYSVSTPEQARQLAQRVIAMGVDQVKVYGFWDLEVLSEITAAAHGAGLGVDADVRHIEAYRTAIRAGVDRLHHVFTADPLSDYSEEDFRFMVRGDKPIGTGPSANILRGPYIVPTIEMRQAYVRVFDFPEVLDHPRIRKLLAPDIFKWLRKTWENPHSVPWGMGAPQRVPVAKEKLKKFIEFGGREQLVAGCDAGSPFNFHSPLTKEVANLREAGLTAMEAIQAATLRPAQMQGVADRVGTISVGKLADLIVVDGDPLRDITLLQTSIHHVIKDGVVYR